MERWRAWNATNSSSDYFGGLLSFFYFFLPAFVGFLSLAFTNADSLFVVWFVDLGALSLVVSRLLTCASLHKLERPGPTVVARGHGWGGGLVVSLLGLLPVVHERRGAKGDGRHSLAPPFVCK